ncbi:NAD(P)-dependent dehydrogenase (short-subunit alcohol dehydrogenase family) [Aquabacterium commune]|uniref:NAD(P)-dependent dehydrogenase (Short-subunit alcohol dehydrogenase family) n=1 Tax=Aquabacterium commune TaxID=70586 RepID=A0A4R6RHM3_9BURK|nr:SDR family NAD(P)-dependent oxidoreductase [Aquabacterium commune]TDP85850.1 NAD(P)-dependent dehydrogenase (short-subunit alcohol dehydrogenase family) [Aquabacterium commune]
MSAAPSAAVEDPAWWADGVAVVIGASGGLGAGLSDALAALAPRGAEQVLRLGRHSDPSLDLLDEASIAQAAQWVQGQSDALACPVRLVIDATGWLHGDGWTPEKTWRQLDAAHMAHAFAVNAIGPALLMKHFLPLMPRQARSVFATLSAKVGSIGDNQLGGWYSYRAAKAALNQLVRTSAIELARTHPQAVCVALHPGTVDTALSAPFARTGLTVRPPAEAAERLLGVLAGLTPERSGRLIDHTGGDLPW